MSGIVRTEKCRRGDKDFEVRAEQEDSCWRVRIFDSGKPLREVVAVISDEIQSDAKSVGYADFVHDIMVVVKNAFERGEAFEVEIAVRKADEPREGA